MRLLIIATILLITSCDSGQKGFLEYKNGRQLLTLNNLKRNGDKLEQPEIGIIKPDSVAIGEEFLAKIFLKTKDYRLAAAYYNCDNVDSSSVDTTNMKINGCKKGLFIENDTIYMAFKPQVAGKYTVDPLTILTQDTGKIFRTLIYTYDHKVVEK